MGPHHTSGPPYRHSSRTVTGELAPPIVVGVLYPAIDTGRGAAASAPFKGTNAAGVKMLAASPDSLGIAKRKIRYPEISVRGEPGRRAAARRCIDRSRGEHDIGTGRNARMSKSSSRGGQNNRANQMNPNNPAYQGSRQGSGDSKPAVDNRSNQLNPNHAPTKPDSDGGTKP
jgi:hypothetical protein